MLLFARVSIMEKDLSSLVFVTKNSPKRINCSREWPLLSAIRTIFPMFRISSRGRGFHFRQLDDLIFDPLL